MFKNIESGDDEIANQKIINSDIGQMMAAGLLDVYESSGVKYYRLTSAGWHFVDKYGPKKFW